GKGITSIRDKLSSRSLAGIFVVKEQSAAGRPDDFGKLPLETRGGFVLIVSFPAQSGGPVLALECIVEEKAVLIRGNYMCPSSFYSGNCSCRGWWLNQWQGH